MSQSPAMPHDPYPGRGPGAPRLTSRSGAGTGSGCRRSWSKSEKMAALAPMPSARETTATAVTNGVLIRARSASFTLDMGFRSSRQEGDWKLDSPTTGSVAWGCGAGSRGRSGAPISECGDSCSSSPRPARPLRPACCDRQAPLQEPSAFEDRRHRPFDPCHPRRRLLGPGKVVEVTPLPPRRERLEGALETRVPAEPLRQLLGNRKIRGLPALHPEPGLLDRDGFAHVGLDGRRLRRDVLHAGELHDPTGVDLTELHQRLPGG